MDAGKIEMLIKMSSFRIEYGGLWNTRDLRIRFFLRQLAEVKGIPNLEQLMEGQFNAED